MSATPADVLMGGAKWSVTHADSLVTLATLPDASVDAIVTDPPYASTGDAASIMKTKDGGFSVPREMQFYEAWVREHLTAWRRVLKLTGAVWCTIDWRGAMCIDQASSRIGMRTPIVGVWDRGGLGMGHILRRVYECFVVVPMRDFERRHTDEPDLWRVQWTPESRKTDHAAQKPVELMRRAIDLVAPEGGVVCDPFAGSGSTGCAAMLSGRRFIGIEREREYAEVARRRCHAADTGASWEDAKVTGQLSLLGGATD